VARHGRKSKAGVNGEEQQPAERFGILVVPAVRAPAEESDDAISDVLIERTPERRLACELEGPGHNYTQHRGIEAVEPKCVFSLFDRYKHYRSLEASPRARWTVGTV
jgi:hypothetical protein